MSNFSTGPWAGWAESPMAVQGRTARAFCALCLGFMLSAHALSPAGAHNDHVVEPHSRPVGHAHTRPEHQLSLADFDNAPSDLVLWGELAKAAITREQGQYQATFLPSVLALEGKTISLIGFMAQVHPQERATQFLLSDIRFLCATCESAPPPQSIVEVNTQEAYPLYERPIRVRGTLELVRDSRYGLMYRLHNAKIIHQ